MQIIRRTSFTALSWKNGGGITHEAMRVPAGNAPFRWRLSVAQIDASGPFSDFSGYQRTMVLLRGAGLQLNFDGAEPKSLTSVGAMAQFDGALKTDCQLLDGPCTDLNLMVARSLRSVTARVEQVRERRAAASASTSFRDGILLIFGIVGALAVAPQAGPAVRLAPWDLAVLPAGGAGAVVAAADEGASPLVFFATVDDNSPSLPVG